jgi:mannose-6-phosphate isomerase-like protein (cupin superfamily)
MVIVGRGGGLVGKVIDKNLQNFVLLIDDVLPFAHHHRDSGVFVILSGNMYLSVWNIVIPIVKNRVEYQFGNRIE